MASSFINDQKLLKGLANLNLRLANCIVYNGKIESTQDRATVNSHYDLILTNLNLLHDEVQTLINSLKDPKLKQEFLDAFSPKQATKQSANKNTTQKTVQPKKATNTINSLKLKLKKYICEVKNPMTKQTSTVDITVTKIEPTTSNNKFKVHAKLGTCQIFQFVQKKLILTYNLKCPNHMAFNLEGSVGEILNCKLKL